MGLDVTLMKPNGVAEEEEEFDSALRSHILRLPFASPVITFPSLVVSLFPFAHSVHNPSS